MSRVDVLTVMDAAKVQIERSLGARSAPELDSAREAVAELIAAAKFLGATLVTPAEPRKPLYTFHPEAVKRLRAAVARATGGES